MTKLISVLIGALFATMTHGVLVAYDEITLDLD